MPIASLRTDGSESWWAARWWRSGRGRSVVRTDPLAVLSAARVTIVAGKGGVGKTTVTAVLAHAAAAAGRRVAVVELDGKPALADLCGDSRASSCRRRRRSTSTCATTASGASPGA